MVQYILIINFKFLEEVSRAHHRLMVRPCIFPFIYKAIFCFVLPTYPLPFLAKMGILEASKYLDCWSSKLTAVLRRQCFSIS